MSALARDWLLDPLALLFLLSLALGAVLARRAAGRAGGAVRGVVVALLWTLAYLSASAPAIVNPLVARHEDRVAARPSCPPGGPLVVLGGGVDSSARARGEYERMRRATLARVAAAERLLRSDATLVAVLAGGGPATVAEADVMGDFLVARGIEPGRLRRERRSRSTAENARETARLLAADGEGPTAPVRLLTSALHMPRAVAAFRASGLEVCPVPVDRIALRDVPLWALAPQTSALAKFDALLHELAAYAIYRVRGDA